MLSIVVSSYQEKYFDQFSFNVKETIGENFQYEIIQIWNPGKMGICEAYNKGADRAQFENLLFVHEDVLFETINWGDILIDYLENESIGCVGVAGANYTPNVPYAWWDLHESSFRYIIQYDNSQFIRLYDLEHDKIALSLDGVFLACRLDIFKTYRFNENIKGFHIYDIDFSNRIAEKFKNIISSKILISHFSEGKIDDNWFLNLVRYRKCFSASMHQKVNKKYEAFFYDCFVEYLRDINIKRWAKLRLLIQYTDPRFIGYKKAIIQFSSFIKFVS